MTEKASAIPITCPHCGCHECFVRKNFPQKLGMAIVVTAAVAFVILAARRETFYLGAMVLAGAVVVDLLLYGFVGKITVCYRCRGEFPLTNPPPPPFELSIAEKYRSRSQ